MAQRACWSQWAAGSADTASIFSKASRCSSTTCSTCSAIVGKVRKRFHRGSTRSRLTSNTTALASAKAAPALKVDDNEVAKQSVPHTIPFIVRLEETFDVGLDTRTGVDDRDYKPPFRFNGKLDKVTLNLGPVVLSEPERKAMHESVIKAKD